MADPIPARSQAPFGGAPLAKLLPHVVRRHALLIGTVTACGAAAGLFLGIIQPNTFFSSGKLLVLPSVRESLSADAAIFATPGATTPQRSRESVTNAIHVIWNDALFDRVVERLGGPDAILALPDPREYDDASTSLPTRVLHQMQAWWVQLTTADLGEGEYGGPDREAIARQVAARELARSVQVVPIQNTTVLEVQYQAPSPQMAQRVVQAVLESAFEVYREKLDRSRSSAQVLAELESAQEEVIAAEQALARFQHEHAIGDLDLERSVQITYLEELEKLLDQDRIERAARDAEVRAIDALLASLPETRGAPPSSGMLSPHYTTLVTALVGLRQRKVDLELQLGASQISRATYDNLAKLLDSAVAETEAQLEKEDKLLELVGENALAANPQFAALQMRRDEAQVAIGRLDSQIVEREKLVAATRERTVELEGLVPAYRKLKTAVQVKAEAERHLSNSASSLENLARLDRMDSSSLPIVQHATFNPEKVGPKRGQILVLGLLAGAGLGLGLAFCRFLATKSVREPEDAMLLGLPVHGVLPRTRRDPGPVPDDALRGIEREVSDVWTRVPLDRGAGRGVSVAFLRDVPGADLSAAAAVFAMGLAIHGQEHVVLICADPAGSWLLRRLGVTPRVGWSDVVAGRATLDEAIVLTRIGHLGVISAGLTKDAGIASAGSRALLERLAGEGCHVVVELPAIARDPSSRAALSFVDGCELVLVRGRSTRQSAADAIRFAERSGTMLAGVLLEDDTPSAHAAGAPPDAADEPPAKAAAPRRRQAPAAPVGPR